MSSHPVPSPGRQGWGTPAASFTLAQVSGNARAGNRRWGFLGPTCDILGMGEESGKTTQGGGRNHPGPVCSRTGDHTRRSLAGLPRCGRQVQPGFHQSLSLCRGPGQGAGVRQQPRPSPSALCRGGREVLFCQLREAAGALSRRSAETAREEGTDMKVKINTDGFEGYAKRALARARKLDRREAIKPQITITFDNPLAMVEVLTAQRLRLGQQGKTKS